MAGENKGFAARWSQRKADARSDTAPESEEPEKVANLPDDAEAQSEITQDPDKPELLTEADFDDVDFDALDKSSDYTRFIQSNVPEEVQKKALRKLWESDSVFEVLDGMNDYDEDFTGNGLAGKVFKSAYQVGRGFITDEDEKPAVENADENATETAEQEQTQQQDLAQIEAVDDEPEKISVPDPEQPEQV